VTLVSQWQLDTSTNKLWYGLVKTFWCSAAQYFRSPLAWLADIVLLLFTASVGHTNYLQHVWFNLQFIIIEITTREHKMFWIQVGPTFEIHCMCDILYIILNKFRLAVASSCDNFVFVYSMFADNRRMQQHFVTAQFYSNCTALGTLSTDYAFSRISEYWTFTKIMHSCCDFGWSCIDLIITEFAVFLAVLIFHFSQFYVNVPVASGLL